MDADFDDGYSDPGPAPRSAPAAGRSPARKPVNDLDDDIPF